MNKFNRHVRKAAISLAAAGLLGFVTTGSIGTLSPVNEVHAASSAANSDSQHALKTLNSFYKPALEGHFPGAVSSFTLGKTTKAEVIKTIGKASIPGKDSDAFDVYTAEMGNPGYAFSYKLDKIREMRYFGTQVERQTNIGGITMDMLKKNWFAPNKVTTIKSGKTTQTKWTYVRGDYKLEFVFNSRTDLDHINLVQ